MTPSDFLPDLPNYDPEPADGMRVGESPVPGLTLKFILREHQSEKSLLDQIKPWPHIGTALGAVSWSPDGRLLASTANASIIYLWDIKTAKTIKKLEGHSEPLRSLAWSPDGKFLASGSYDKTIRIWDISQGKTVAILNAHAELVSDVSWSSDGKYIASGSFDRTFKLWRIDKLVNRDELTVNVHRDYVVQVRWSPDAKILASGSDDQTVRLWSFNESFKDLDLIATLEGHNSAVVSLAWSNNGTLLASGSYDRSICIWDINKISLKAVQEGHTDIVRSLSFSSDDKLLASIGHDNTTKLWQCDRWEVIASIPGSIPARKNGPLSLSFHPSLPMLAVLEQDSSIRIWDIDMNVMLRQTQSKSLRYTTAKLVLVGDSGVGKTGLGWRLAHNDFKEHSSTHGQQFWVIDKLGKTRDDGTECEAVLWDLAGQHVYRPIHSIFLDNVDASLVLFDPTNRQDPLKGAQFWLEQLKGNKQLPPSLLVGARIDRGGAAVSQEYLEQFCQKYNISGGYVGTSAKTGEGLDELIQQIKSQITWDEMTTTVTTVTFKRIKDYVLALKEKTDRKGVLVQPAELRQQLQETDPDWQFTNAEMMTAVGHLETHGYVTILKSSAGDSHILLTPDLLVDLASSIVLVADKHPRELGAISEGALLQGNYTFDELEGLEEAEKQILFDAAVLRFLEHNVCFRETLGTENLLIFPGLIKEKRPLIDNFETEEDISYIVRGSVENVYAGLVVLLGYTQTFTRINQWQNQAQYEMDAGEICGFRQIEERAGEIELILYYATATPKYARNMFQGLFEKFLYQRDVYVTPYPPLYCSKNHLQERATVIKRLRDQKDFLCCEECGERITLQTVEQPLSLGERDRQSVNRAEALANLRKSYEIHLSRVKGFRRDRVSPRCFISYLPEQSAWITQLVSDLRNAGVYIVENCTQVKSDDFILLIKTPNYSQAWKRQSDSLSEDIVLVQRRLNQIQQQKTTVVPLLRNGTPHSTRLNGVKGIRASDFRDETQYSVALYDLVLTLYSIPFNQPAFKPLRAALQQQWENTLSQFPKEKKLKMRPLKIFISYAHKDEPFKDELVTMLAILQQENIVDAWQDRLIEPGDEWYQATQTAMSECDLAVLLVSKNFLASRFITDQEVPKLLQRRQNEGMRVIPIIIRPCMWSRQPILKKLQALPRDGKPVITFPEETGERDQAWTDIAKAIEKFAKDLRSDDT